MATRGVFQLRSLTIYYHEYGGSSAKVRQFLQSPSLIQWAKDHPHVQIHVQPRKGGGYGHNGHPYVHGHYVNSLPNTNRLSFEEEDQPPPLKTAIAAHHQITLKNAPTLSYITNVMDTLVNRSGRKLTKLTQPVISQTPSIQGLWTPSLNIAHVAPTDGTDDDDSQLLSIQFVTP